MARAKTRTVCIPTVGTVLALAKDWTFDLLAEYRNTGMMAHLEAQGVIPPDAPHYLPVRCGQEVAGTVRRLRASVAAAGRFQWQSRSAYTEADYEVVPHTYHCWREAGHDGGCDKDARVEQHIARYACTVPRGVALRVDRIYIRRGASDFDSLTFWAQNLTAAKRVRFFAKLADVNRMVVHVGDAPAPARAARVAPPVFRAILLRE